MKRKKCCPAWAIITGIIFFISVVVIVVCVLKKFAIFGCCPPSDDEGLLISENTMPENGESGVRYTTDQDFV